MCFNTDPSKQPIEISFARKSDVEVYLLVELENSLNSPVQILKSQKHFGQKQSPRGVL